MGKGTTYPGLVPLIHAYLDQVGVDTVTRKRVNLYLDLIVQRATGELLTPACWIRKFVHNHPAYKKDSKVPQEVAYDLLRRIDGISRGDIHEPLLFGDIEFDPISKRDAFPASFDARRKSATSYVCLRDPFHSARSRSAAANCSFFSFYFVFAFFCFFFFFSFSLFLFVRCK